MKRVLPFLALALFTACSDSTSPGGNDSDKGTADLAPPLPKRDSVAIDAAASSMKWKRDKTVKDVEQTVKIGKASMKMKLDQASFSVSGDIPVQSGAWYVLDKEKFDGGYVRLDMTQLKGVQINADERLEMTSPDYLDVKNFPSALLRVRSVKAIDGPASMEKYTVQAELTIKDTSAVIEFPAEGLVGKNGVPERLEGQFTIDGMKWGLNRKNAKVVRDELEFAVVLVTKK